MKTTLPAGIGTIEQAKAFLTALHKNGESFHPEDDAFEIEWDIHTVGHISRTECQRLNSLMADIYKLPGNDGRHSAPMVFDPCEFLNELDSIKNRNDKDMNIDDLINPDEDDRIFTANDMVIFALKMALFALDNEMYGAKISDHIINEIRFEEGDGSYETYKMPERSQSHD